MPENTSVFKAQGDVVQFNQTEVGIVEETLQSASRDAVEAGDLICWIRPIGFPPSTPFWPILSTIARIKTCGRLA